MKTTTSRMIAILLTLAGGAARAETLEQYVLDCKSAVGLSSTTTLPALNCNDGVRFAGGTGGVSLINDFVGYSRISDQVDLTFACRWLETAGLQASGPGPFATAASVELMLHNRQNGATCFFAAKPTNTTERSGVSAALPSLTGTNPSSFWMTPTELNTVAPDTGAIPGGTMKCVACHAAGAYIASPSIASSLGLYGLLNNNHDTNNNRYQAVNSSVASSAFSGWNTIKTGMLTPTACANQCHVVGNPNGFTCPPGLTNCPVPGIAGNAGQVVIPSLFNDITAVSTAQVMPPAVGGDYGSINLSFPANGYEVENFVNAKSATSTYVPVMLSSCGAPGLMEMHVAGNQSSMLIASPGRYAFLPDKLATFDAKHGLVCLNNDQETGTLCQDYRVHYACTTSAGVTTWTAYQSVDTPAGDGDHEERPANVCPSGSTVTGIEASTTINGNTFASIGPNDKLARLSQYGLTCFTADQPDGQCSNYVVKYSGCTTAPFMQVKTLTSVFVTGKQLTAASNNLVKGQAHNSSWNTQQWIIEPVVNTEYVRLRPSSAAAYLAVPSNAESAVVGTLPSSTSEVEMWLIEPVSGSSTQVRLKNLSSGKYLTIADPKNVSAGEQDYLPIYSQGRNNTWTSQLWLLQ